MNAILITWLLDWLIITSLANKRCYFYRKQKLFGLPKKTKEKNTSEKTIGELFGVIRY